MRKKQSRIKFGVVHDKNYKHVQHDFCVIDQMLIKQRTETTNCF